MEAMDIHDIDIDMDSVIYYDNDPDHQYFLDDSAIIDITDDTYVDPTSSPVSDPPASDEEVIDLTDYDSTFNEGDYLTDEHFARLLRQWREISDQAAPKPEKESQTPEPEYRRIIPEACIDNIIYRAGLSVELHDDSFLRIEAVLEDVVSGEIFLRGRRLFKITDGYLDTCIPIWRGELLWVIAPFTRDDVPLIPSVKRFCNIRFTNQCKSMETREPRPLQGTLFCRLKQIRPSDPEKDSGCGIEGSVAYLTPDEADQGYRIPLAVLRQNWRGTTTPFGDVESQQSSPRGIIDLEASSGTTLIDLTQAEEEPDTNTPPARKYTFGDGFCGAGGVSRGAKTAGLEIKWAFDNNAHAMNSYRMNFPSASCEHTDVFDFLTRDADYLRVDISHGSPPCQTFSAAHTVNCARDDENSACVWSCADLIRKAKPRVHTMEETSGLSERHTPTFFSVVQDFIDIGYSVRWKIVNCMEYGVPQSRRRLIIIASGPGESLPPFPKPTHGLPGSGLLPLTTINSLIANIPRTASDHDVDGALIRGFRNGYRDAFDGNQQAKTITCSGGERNYHPSGRRGFTNREFACLQTFPMEHRFGTKEVRKQIGNAVPPILAKAIYREIIKSLRRTDEQLTAEDPTAVIEL